MENVVEIVAGGKAFDDEVVFSDVNSSFESGKVYALSGPSGGGKTTLLNGIGQLEPLSSGQVLFNGKPVEQIPILDYFRHYIGYLVQNYALVDEETVQQNVSIAGRQKTRVISAFLKRYGLDDSYLKRKVYTLSGGEAQRVALTRLSLQDPLIVLADEPTGALDHQNAAVVMDSLRELADEGKIVIVATHDDFVKQRVDKIVDIEEFK